MFRIEAAYILYFIPLLLLGLGLLWLSLNWKTTVLDNAGEHKVLSRLFPDWSSKKAWAKGILVLVSSLFLFVSWANPQWGTRTQKVKSKSTDVIIALDISQSMLAEDISPNRMERAKRFCGELLKKLRGERIGLIFFAGSAYLQMPLSQDQASAELYINSASPKQAGTQGTVIADAIEMAANIFNTDKPSQKALIIISDGENHEQEAINAAKKANESGTHIFTLGIGSEEGAPVPFEQNGRTTYKSDKEGNPVKSALNVGMLKDIAESGGGEFYMIDQVMSALSKLDNEIEALEKVDVEQRSFTDFNSYFQFFLLPAILMLLLESLISETKGTGAGWRNIMGLKPRDVN